MMKWVMQMWQCVIHVGALRATPLRRDRASPVPTTHSGVASQSFYIGLQHFAAADEGRTEDPTERKIRKAREEGRVAKSQELVGALVLLFPAAAIWIMGQYIFRTCLEMLDFFFNRAVSLDPVTNPTIAPICAMYFLRMAAPIIGIALAAGVIANVAQVGWLFTTKPLTPDFSKIVPHFGRYFQKTIGSVEGLFNLFKSIFKMIVIGIVAYFLISSEVEKFRGLQSVSIWNGLTLTASLGARLLIVVALLLLALSIPDIFIQKWQFKEQMKMTPQEVKQERKEEEGDPQVQARIRQRMREMISRNMIANVPKADVVVTNPTHYAVALEYNRERDTTPRVTAKGADEIARRIREVAKENEVPVIENPPLARFLYANVEIGDNIDKVPYEYITAVAAVLNTVYAMKERSAYV
ncbi:MAG: flagellar biosynthesis protein FlhB [Spirochaetaceae bacterium]|jgi:flagellar biosynthetic protein FlhB|nr:flagellar biosynthesis protein FlhB [Spirochaetaceae bacterium]